MDTAEILAGRDQLAAYIDTQLIPPGPAETLYTKPVIDGLYRQCGTISSRLVSMAVRERLEQLRDRLPDMMSSPELRAELLATLPEPRQAA